MNHPMTASGGVPCESLPVSEPRLAGEIADTEAADCGLTPPRRLCAAL